MPTEAAAGRVTPFPAGRARPRPGLVLTGGGARAAYQVGVLKAVRDILGSPVKNPFPILTGTSAGAINAATLAVFADNYTRAVGNLLEVWEHMHCHHVYRTDVASIMRSGARWLAAMMLISRRNPVSLLDNSPLADLLARTLPFERIQDHIDSGALYAVCVTASGYTSGQSVSFFQGGPGLEGWERNQRIGAAVTLKLDYLLASSALPFIFPAVKVHREYFGDGSVRQIAPISPALHLGADRVFVVGTGRQSAEAARARSNVYPSLAQIAGHALNSIFLDGLSVDIERLERINRTVSLIPPERLAEAGLPLRPVKVFFISPSQPIERIAARFVHELPRTVRFLLRPTGALNRSGSNLASYLLFEEPFTRALIDLGYQDTAAREREVREFFAGSEIAAGRGGMTMAEPNTPPDPFEMYRRLWGPLGVPVPGMAMPTLDPQEVDKRIQELKAVETWLNMNLNMLRLAIQGLEMQKAGLAAMQQAMSTAGAAQDKDRKP